MNPIIKKTLKNYTLVIVLLKNPLKAEAINQEEAVIKIKDPLPN
jgi:hypothetical protein